MQYQSILRPSGVEVRRIDANLILQFKMESNLKT